MGYYILKRKDIMLIFACMCTILVFTIFGAQQVMEVSANLNELPIYSVDTDNQEKLLSLGINCAWGDSDISSILNTLDKANVKATFFIVGDWADRYPQRVKEIYDKGHEIANHSNTHPDMTALSKDEIEEEILSCNEKLENIVNETTKLFRCPSGSYNDLVVKTIKELGFYPIQWSFDTLDWKDTTPSQMVERIVPNLTYGDIILLHNDTKYTKDALPVLIDEIKNKGYEFTTVGELIHKDNYYVDITGRQFKK